MVTWTPLSGGVVRVEWKEPAVTNGVILYYVVNLTRCWHDESEIESRHVNNSATYAVVFNSGQLCKPSYCQWFFSLHFWHLQHNYR